MNHGAHRCVIQRVKKMPGVGPPAGNPENTRTWSMAISTITMPRRMSTDATRREAATVAAITEVVLLTWGSEVSSVLFAMSPALQKEGSCRRVILHREARASPDSRKLSMDWIRCLVVSRVG